MAGISLVCLLPSSGEIDIGEHRINGRSDNSTAMSVCRSRLLAIPERSTEWASQTRVSRVLQSN